MSDTKVFPTAVVLSAITGTVLVQQDAGGHGATRQFIHFVEGPGTRMASAAYSYKYLPKFKAFLIQQHPQLSHVNADDLNHENWQAWLAKQVATLGETLAFRSMTTAEHRDAYLR